MNEDIDLDIRYDTEESLQRQYIGDCFTSINETISAYIARHGIDLIPVVNSTLCYETEIWIFAPSTIVKNEWVIASTHG